MTKKEVVIFIPGANSLFRWPEPIRNLTLKLERFLGIKPTLNDHVSVWKKSEHFKNKEFIWMHWRRGIDPISKYLAKLKLQRLLKHYKNGEVTLVGTSLGGDIILEILKEVNHANIKKIILVCSINEIKNLNFPHPKIYNIFSKADKLAELAINFYSPFNGGEIILGKNVKNIIIPKFDHADFCDDGKIKSGKYKGMKMTELISFFLNL